MAKQGSRSYETIGIMSVKGMLEVAAAALVVFAMVQGEKAQGPGQRILRSQHNEI